MTTTNNTEMTRLEVAESLLAEMADNDPRKPVIQAWKASLLKQRERKSIDQKKVNENNAAVAAVVKALHENPELVRVNSTWISKNIPGINSTQRATGAMNAGLRSGDLIRVTYKKKPFFTLPELKAEAEGLTEDVA